MVSFASAEHEAEFQHCLTQAFWVTFLLGVSLILAVLMELAVKALVTYGTLLVLLIFVVALNACGLRLVNFSCLLVATVLSGAVAVVGLISAQSSTLAFAAAGSDGQAFFFIVRAAAGVCGTIAATAVICANVNAMLVLALPPSDLCGIKPPQAADFLSPLEAETLSSGVIDLERCEMALFGRKGSGGLSPTAVGVAPPPMAAAVAMKAELNPAPLVVPPLSLPSVSTARTGYPVDVLRVASVSSNALKKGPEVPAIPLSRVKSLKLGGGTPLSGDPLSSSAIISVARSGGASCTTRRSRAAELQSQRRSVTSLAPLRSSLPARAPGSCSSTKAAAMRGAAAMEATTSRTLLVPSPVSPKTSGATRLASEADVQTQGRLAGGPLGFPERFRERADFAQASSTVGARLPKRAAPTAPDTTRPRVESDAGSSRASGRRRSTGRSRSPRRRLCRANSSTFHRRASAFDNAPGAERFDTRRGTPTARRVMCGTSRVITAERRAAMRARQRSAFYRDGATSLVRHRSASGDGLKTARQAQRSEKAAPGRFELQLSRCDHD